MKKAKRKRKICKKALRNNTYICRIHSADSHPTSEELRKYMEPAREDYYKAVEAYASAIGFGIDEYPYGISRDSI